MMGGGARTVIRVVILAGIRLYREGLAEILRQREGIEVVTTAASGEPEIGSIRAIVPDVVLLDMAMLDSAATVRALLQVVPGIKIIALAVPDTESHVVACAEAGIAGYVSRDGSVDDLVAALESASRGEALCSPRIVAGLLRRVAALALPGEPEPPRRLTRREVEVVELIDQGLTNKEIARRLVIELSTVKNHVHNILEKLGVSHRGEAAAHLREHAPLLRVHARS
jgi:two-component system, NarL family, nitrate/nitrite response regulator NarL